MYTEQLQSSTQSSLTILDRRVIVVLPHPNETASRRHEISARVERLHRLQGTSVLFDVSKLLVLGASTFATACSIFHRFFHRASLTEFDVWSIALASLMLATKVEEEPQQLKTIIHGFCHIYRKRVIVLDRSKLEEDGWDWNHSALRFVKEATTWSKERKLKFLKEEPLPGKLGPVFDDWHKQALNSEAAVLRQLGFTLYWIPDSHPHNFILYFCQALGLAQPRFTQRAWNYCNDSCRLDLCTRFAPEVIAASTIVLTQRDFSLELPLSPRPWWEVFVGKVDGTDVVTAANAILGLSNLDKEYDFDAWTDSMVASRGYVRSCIEGKVGSFNDPASPGKPASYLWEQMADATSRMSLRYGHD